MKSWTKAAPPLAAVGMAPGSSTARSLGSRSSSQSDSTVDFFPGFSMRQLRPQSTTCRLFLHDIPWKGASLPLSGVPAQPAACLRLGTGAGFTRGARSSSHPNPGRCPRAPCPLNLAPLWGMGDPWCSHQSSGSRPWAAACGQQPLTYFSVRGGVSNLN